MQALLANRFQTDAGRAVWAHPLLAVLLAVLLRAELSYTLGLELVAVVGTGTVLRAALLRHAAEYRADLARRVRWIRHSTSIQALAWGVGAFLVIPAASPGADGRFLMLCAGLVAGALATHQADRVGFHRYIALLLVPAIAARAMGADGLMAVDLLLVTVFWGVMGMLHRHSMANLVQGLRSNLRLQEVAERASHEQEFVGAVLSGSPLAVAVVSPDGRVDRHSSEFQRVMATTGGGSTPSPASGNGTAPGHPLQPHLRRVADAARSHGRAREEVEIPSVPTPLTFRISAASAGGAATGWVICVLEDLTPIRVAERARAEAEASYQDLVQSAHDLIWKTDARGNWTYLNAAAGEIYGVSPIDLLGTSVAGRATPEHSRSDMAAFESVLRGTDVVNHETVHLAADGMRRVLSFSARPLYDEEGRISGAQGVARDVTERWEAEEEARRLAREAARATHMKSAFLANMSHEIRTPMNGVLGMTELLLASELSDEQRHYLEIIQNSGANLLRLLNDILDFSKIEAGHLELEAIDFDPARTVADAVRVLQPTAEQKGNRLILEVDPALPGRAQGDPGRLSQVVTNLVSNAVKFTAGGTVTVAARLQGDGRELHLSVQDTGLGIPEDKLEDIFGEFAQADASVTRRFGGTGLGLAICRSLVELMGGRLQVQSTLGEGSEFYFSVPLVDPDFQVASSYTGKAQAAEPPAGGDPEGREPAPAQGAVDGAGAIPFPGAAGAANSPSSPVAEPGDPAPPDTPSPGARILLAEDTPVNQQVALAVLRKAGYEVDLVEDGQAAVEARRDGDYHLILMDIQMPVLDGLEATRRIRDMEYGGIDPVPIVALTAHALAEERNRCLAAGMDDFLSKPFRSTDLLRLVEKWVRVEAPEAREPDPVEVDEAPVVEDDPDAPVQLAAFRAGLEEAGIGSIADTMLQLFLEELPGRLDDIQRAAAGGDLATLATAAHALKSSAGNVRADRLFAHLRALESAARGGDEPTAQDEVIEVLQEAARARDFLGAVA
jgi:PAS domain S-box-containing protein